MEPEDEEEEPKALEYARYHGLCISYDTEAIDFSTLRPIPDTDIDDDSLNPSTATITDAVHARLKERLEVSKDAALLLKSIHDLRLSPTPELQKADRRKWLMSLKQELPVLQTDSDLDLLTFGSDTVPSIRNLNIPTEVVNEEQDEGFAWPAKYSAYPAQYNEQVRAEKIAVSKDVLLYLQDVIRDPCNAVDIELVQAGEMCYKPITAVCPLTPPLLPLSPPLTPYIPSSPANHLPLLSESNDSVAVEAKDLEEQILAADSIARRESSDSMLLELAHPSDFDSLFENQLTPNMKRRADDLKVEGPLTPLMFSDSPMKKLKSVSFTADLHEVIPNTTWARPFSSDSCSNAGSSSVYNDLFGNIEPVAEKARQMVENEKLSGADTRARAEVPELDFTLPIAPWNEYSLRRRGKRRSDKSEVDAQMQFLLRVKLEDLRSAAPWHGLSSLERELRWSVFTTNITKITIEEKLHGETELLKILENSVLGDIVSSSSQVWKREGVRMLEEEEEEDEIEMREHEGGEDMESLVRKRKLELEEEMADLQGKRKMLKSTPQNSVRPQGRQGSQVWDEQSHMNDFMEPASRTMEPSEQRFQLSTAEKAPQATSKDLMFGGFSATSALHRFMETRGKVVAQPMAVAIEEAHLSTLRSAEPSMDLVERSRGHSTRKNNIPTESAPCAQLSIQTGEQEATKPLPNPPAVPIDLPPCSLIVSTTFLQQRSFMKQIEQLCPAAEITYRDYQLPHSPCREADMILSPCTGMINTTLQQIKQRPLPGQPDRNPVKERILALELRYERLVVMVSEGLSRVMEEHGASRPDDPRDKEALSSLQSFADQLEGEVLINCIQGGEKALARSVVLEIAKYSLPHGSRDIGDIKLLAMETTWETFLRRAGFNPFAAQVIVAWLKKPYDIQTPISSSSPAYAERPAVVSVFGLSAFLTMDGEERVRYFQALMGGSRILKKVNSVLGQGWVSAAHGFRL